MGTLGLLGPGRTSTIILSLLSRWKYSPKLVVPSLAGQFHLFMRLGYLVERLSAIVFICIDYLTFFNVFTCRNSFSRTLPGGLH